MFPNSILGHPPFTPDHQHHNNFFAPSPTFYSHQQLVDSQFNIQNAALSRAMSLQQLTYGNVSPKTSMSPIFQGRKRLSDEKNLPLDSKWQRFHSPHKEPTVVNQIVPSSGERRYTMPPLFHTPYVPETVGCVPPFREIPFLEPREITLPEAKDKSSQQILELFETCQQQMSDLKKKELCQAQLQRESQLLFPQSRLFLVGSSLNGFGTQRSDGDLCLVVKVNCFFQVNQKTEAQQMLMVVHKHFCTGLSGYMERPQLIRAKVPVVKFRDKVSCVEFDLNVNNIVYTFLLRTYAYLLPEPILPSLQKIYSESFSLAIQLQLIHQAPCNIPPYLSENESSLGDLLLGFLKYYAIEFDWNSQMTLVREAKAIARPDGIEWRNKYIHVEEPFDGTNTARGMHEKQQFDMIKDQFLKSFHRLKNKTDLNTILPLRTAILKR
ncbi:LOW QUALITY PROTEIN: poly(A) RNA polymerase GLD2-like [Erethizon dorsatum]